MADDTITITRAELVGLADIIARQTAAVMVLVQAMPRLNGDACNQVEQATEDAVRWLARQTPKAG